MPTETSQYTAGVDWLTGTATESPAIGYLRVTMESIFTDLRQQGTLSRSWSHLGGYQGLAMDGVHYGEGPQGAIAVISGSDAMVYWARVIDIVKPTRIDLQVTALLPKPMHLASLYYDSLEPNKTRQFTLLTGTAGGATLYVGVRSSLQFGRLYDKGVEEGTYRPGWLWRYEVECKGRAATATKRLLQCGASSLGALIADIVWRWYDDRGCPPIWPLGACEVVLTTDAKVSDRDRTLRWLARSIRPCLNRLQQAGVSRPELFDTLGLESPSTINVLT